MKGKFSMMLVLAAVLLFSGQALAAGAGTQTRGLNRAPVMTGAGFGQAVASQQRTMTKQQLKTQQRLQIDQQADCPDPVAQNIRQEIPQPVTAE